MVEHVKTTRRAVRLAWVRHETKEKRRNIGRLTNNIVTQRIRKRYNLCVNNFVTTWRMSLSGSAETIDEALADYIECLCTDGEPTSSINYLLAGVQLFCPRLRTQIPRAWQLVKAWQRKELPERAPPFIPLIVQALACWWLSHGKWGLAVGTLLAFHCLLHTGEMSPFVKMACHKGRCTGRCPGVGNHHGWKIGRFGPQTLVKFKH